VSVQSEWISLSDAYVWLHAQNIFFMIGDMAMEMMTRAIRHGVPVRGIREWEMLSDEIDGRQVRAFNLLCILKNEIETNTERFHSAEINRHEDPPDGDVNTVRNAPASTLPACPSCTPDVDHYGDNGEDDALRRAYEIAAAVKAAGQFRGGAYATPAREPAGPRFLTIVRRSRP
jgi:hypothetical protein